MTDGNDWWLDNSSRELQDLWWHVRCLCFTFHSCWDCCPSLKQTVWVIYATSKSNSSGSLSVTTRQWYETLKKTTLRQSNRHNRKVWKHPVKFDSGFGCRTCRKKEVKSLNEVNILHSSGQTDPVCDWTVRSSWLLSDCTSKKKKRDC